MKKVLIATLLVLLAGGASAQICYNPVLNECKPNIFGECPEGWTEYTACPVEQPTPVPTVAPTPVPTPKPNYFDTHGIKLGAAAIMKLLAFLTGLVTAVQFVKKALENLSKWQWLINLIPPLAQVFAFFAKGIGPLILNAALTIGTMVPVAVTDGLLSVLEIASIVGVIIGNDLLYRIFRDLGAVWPRAKG